MPGEGQTANSFHERAMAALRSHGLRVTGPRQEVVRVLAETDRALSPYEIHGRVLERGGRLDVVSVYRILQAFSELGLVHHLGAVDGYMPCTLQHQAHHSQHVICDRCHRVVEVDPPDPAVAQALALVEREGFANGQVRIEILAESCGRCR